MRVLLLAAIEDLEEAAEAALASDVAVAGIPKKIVFDWPHEERLVQLAGTKNCLWLEKAAPRGYVCRATANEDEPYTVMPVCLSCGIPDAGLICAHLAFPCVAYLNPGGPSLPQRHPVSALCEIGQQCRGGNECRPGGKECWVRRVEWSLEVPALLEHAAERFADEISHFRLAYRDRFANAEGFWPIGDPSQVMSVALPCDSAQAFGAHVLALAEILNRMNSEAQLAESSKVDSTGKKLRGLLALERLLNDEAGGRAIFNVTRLRKVFKIRTSQAHGATDDVLAAFRDLGVDSYPPRSWGRAWERVLSTVCGDLREVRLALGATFKDSDAQ